VSETDKFERLVELLDRALESLKQEDADAAALFLMEAEATADRLPKKETAK
jgi:hypothetical protein